MTAVCPYVAGRETGRGLHGAFYDLVSRHSCFVLSIGDEAPSPAHTQGEANKALPLPGRNMKQFVDISSNGHTSQTDSQGDTGQEEVWLSPGGSHKVAFHSSLWLPSPLPRLRDLGKVPLPLSVPLFPQV